MTHYQCNVIVVGAGPAGLTAAIALAAAGVGTALVAKWPSVADQRTTALLASSVTALRTLGVWALCVDHAAPMRELRLIDASARLLRAPEVVFAADEIGLASFGYNIENRVLLAALISRARSLPGLELIERKAVAVENAADRVTVRLEAGASVSAQLVIGADGRRSACRAAAGIELHRQSCPQSALTLNLRHNRPHKGAATEFHTESGPLTLVPLPEDRSSLVLVTEPEQAQRLAGLNDTALAAEIERRAYSILGRMHVEPGRALFPLALENSSRMAAGRIALIGEAAHVMPPIGAQGLNLGLRDAAAIAELVMAAHRERADLGSAALIEHYQRLRSGDVASRMLAVELLNRSLLSEFLPFYAARGLGLYLMQKIAPLRHAVMREGVAPSASQPRLMRGEAL